MSDHFTLASFPGARKIGESAWYTLFVHVRSLFGNLHTIHYTNHALTKQSISVYLLISHTAELCSLWDTFRGGGFKSKMLSLSQQRLVSSCSGRSMNFKVKDYIIHVSQCSLGMDKQANNFCKRRAGCFYRFLVIVSTEHGQWQSSLTPEKSTDKPRLV